MQGDILCAVLERHSYFAFGDARVIRRARHAQGKSLTSLPNLHSTHSRLIPCINDKHCTPFETKALYIVRWKGWNINIAKSRAFHEKSAFAFTCFLRNTMQGALQPRRPLSPTLRVVPRRRQRPDAPLDNEMALPMLISGADCGPVNPLQGLTKRFDQDRGIQQVRRQSLARSHVAHRICRTSSAFLGQVLLGRCVIAKFPLYLAADLRLEIHRHSAHSRFPILHLTKRPPVSSPFLLREQFHCASSKQCVRCLSHA